MSKYSFGIYLSHYVFIYIFSWTFKDYWGALNLALRLTILFTLTFIVSKPTQHNHT